MTGTWIKRADIPPAHYCHPPSHDRFSACTTAQGGEKIADGIQGDLWGCDECGTVWKVDDDLHWQHAGWLTQRRHHPRCWCGGKVGLEHTHRPSRYGYTPGKTINELGPMPDSVPRRPRPPRGGGGVGNLHRQKPTRTISDIANDMTTEE